ncbi:MAG TPA: hypothetical protein VLA09_07435 [Longimicrobiales bacterium]|nr:hypothetical protein [Longimicrobiales bacterium]
MTHRLANAAAGAALLISVGVSPTELHAQLGRLPGPGATDGWPAVEVGARVGYDSKQRQEVVGAMLRIPILPNARVELVPNADVTFFPNLKEYQVNFEAVYVVGGREGGLYAGGGVGFRNAIMPLDAEAGRQNLRTYSVVVGVKLGGVSRVNPLIEFRRVFPDGFELDPQLVSLGVTLALW